MDYKIVYKDELYHHGVKGMKWGVRRTPEQLGRRSRDSNSLDEKYVYNTARKIYRLNSRNELGRGTNRTAKKQMKLEEELEDYLSMRSAHSKKYREILDRAREKEANRTINDPYFKRKAALTASKGTFDVSKFEFRRTQAMRPDGTVETYDVPVDKKGYAKAFAKAMTSSGKNKSGDYDYYYDYMMKRLKLYDSLQ